MIRLQTVQAKDRNLLWNINQKYLYEMNEKIWEQRNSGPP